MTLRDIEEYFNSCSLPYSLQINSFIFTPDLRRTINGYIYILKSNPGNPAFLPYYQNLMTIYEKIKDTSGTGNIGEPTQ